MPGASVADSQWLRTLAAAQPKAGELLGRSVQEQQGQGYFHTLREICQQPSTWLQTSDRMLARTFRDHPRVRVIELEDSTNDRSLVMTSSFTNLVLAARFLGMLNVPERYRALCENLSRAGRELLRRHFGTLARVGACGFRRAVYLGSGPRLGAAREAALKMLEMTAGSVATLCESYLAFRHGPMSFAHDDTLIICFLSSGPTLRAYESDLLREVDEKELGLSKLIVGESIPLQLLRKND